MCYDYDERIHSAGGLATNHQYLGLRKHHLPLLSKSHTTPSPTDVDASRYLADRRPKMAQGNRQFKVVALFHMCPPGFLRMLGDGKSNGYIFRGVCDTWNEKT